MTVEPHRHEIRHATPADLEAILAIAAASPEVPRWQPPGYHPYLSPGSPNATLHRTALIASSDEEIIAFAAASLLLDGEQNLCQLDSMAVHPAARRQRLATNLLRAILAWALQNGARHLALEVRAGNAPAIALYRRLGLVEEGRRPRYYTHPQEDALLLGIPLP
jgi:ribosomal-protein-alanine N-acetyltransferase